MKMKGLFPTLITPMDADGRFDSEQVGRLVENLACGGVDGFYVGGSTGESYLLSMDERKALLEAVVEACPKHLKVIANVGKMATEHSIELAWHAEGMAVSVISSVPPFYFSYNQDEIVRYYLDLAEAVNVPVLIYNIPAMSGVTFSMDSLNRLLEDGRIMGLKHTSYVFSITDADTGDSVLNSDHIGATVNNGLFFIHVTDIASQIIIHRLLPILVFAERYLRGFCRPSHLNRVLRFFYRLAQCFARSLIDLDRISG